MIAYFANAVAYTNAIKYYFQIPKKPYRPMDRNRLKQYNKVKYKKSTLVSNG